jgi:hypothetical protein
MISREGVKTKNPFFHEYLSEVVCIMCQEAEEDASSSSNTSGEALMTMKAMKLDDC